jgi:hypothetical protein
MCRCAPVVLAVLVVSGTLTAQAPAPVLDIRVSTETVPAGAMAQIKVYLGTPQPISSGSIGLTFTGLPAGASAIQGLTVFSATGDVTAVGLFDYRAAFELNFLSPSAGVGRLPGVPILEFSIPVPNGFSVAVIGSFSGPAGTYAMTAQPGGAAIGGSLSIQTVTPATGYLPAGSQLIVTGVGFQSGTDVEIEGVSLASVDIASPTVIDATVSGATEITGKQIALRNPDGSQVTYWGGLTDSLFTFPLNPTPSAICGRMGPAFDDPISLVVQNPNPVPAQVTIGNAIVAAPGQTLTVTVPSGGAYETAISDPPYSTVQSDPSTPIRTLCFVLEDYSFDLLTVLPVVSQVGPVPSIGSIVNAASGAQSAVSPGEIVTIYGVNIGPIAPAGVTVDSFGNVGRNLNGAQVLFDGIPAPLLYASASQVNAVVPYEIFSDTVTTLQVEYNGATSAALGRPGDSRGARNLHPQWGRPGRRRCSEPGQLRE